MPPRTTIAAYAERTARIDKLIRVLRFELEKHAHAQAVEPRNWGYVGDLAHVEELLAQAVVFLGDAETEPADLDDYIEKHLPTIVQDDPWIIRDYEANNQGEE